MITITVTNGIPERELTSQELQTVRFPSFYHVNANGDHCFIEFGDEASNDPDVQAAYADVQAKLDDINTNSNATFMLHNFNETPDSQFLRLAQHIAAAQAAQNN